MFKLNVMKVFTGSRIVEVPDFILKFLNDDNTPSKYYDDVRNLLFYADEAGYSDAQVYVVLAEANKVSPTNLGTGLSILIDDTKTYDERIKALLAKASNEGLVADGINVKENGNIVKTFNPDDSKFLLYPSYNASLGTIYYINGDSFEINKNVLSEIIDGHLEEDFDCFLYYLGKSGKTHAEVYVIMDGAIKVTIEGSNDFIDFLGVPHLYDLIISECLAESELVAKGNDVLKDGKVIKSFTFNENMK